MNKRETDDGWWVWKEYSAGIVLAVAFILGCVLGCLGLRAWMGSLTLTGPVEQEREAWQKRSNNERLTPAPRRIKVFITES